METLKMNKNKFLVMLIIFMMLFSNFGYTLVAIASSDEFEVIKSGFFKKDEIKFNAYFEDENGKQLTEITENVNEKVKLVVEVLPQVEGYLRNGTIRAVPSDDTNINFKFANVSENLLDESKKDAQDALKDALLPEEPNEGENTEQNTVPSETVENPDAENTVENNTVADNTVADNTNTSAGNVISDSTSALSGALVSDVTNPLQSAMVGTSGNTATNTVENTTTENTVANSNTVENNQTGRNPLMDALTDTNTNTIGTEPVNPSEEPTEEIPDEDKLVDEDVVIKEVTEESRISEEIDNAILDIKLESENEISLNNIIKDTKIEIELEYVQGETFKVEDLYKDIKLQMSGTFINKKLEEVKVGKEEEFSIGWEYTKDITLESEYTKISPFELEDIKGTIVENKITVTRDIQDEKYLPVKSTRLEVVVPEVNGKKPIAVDVIANKLMATKGEDSGYVRFTQDNWKYDEENGLINVFVENNDNVYSKGSDEYVIIYRYEDYVESESSNLARNVKATVTEYSAKNNNNLVKEIKDSQDVKVDVGQIVTYSIGTNEDTINKARIYANYNSETPIYETLFTNQVKVNILTSDVLEQLKIDCTKEVYKDANGVELEAKGIEYKQIRFNYTEISSLLSEGGEIVITNTAGETLYVLNKDVIRDEEDCNVNLNGANGIYIYANNISKNGAINFELTKAIKKCNYDKTIFKSITQIESRISAEVKYVNIADVFTMQTIAVAKDFEESKTTATISINRDNLSTIKTNANVELKIELNNDKEDSDLYVNPSFEIVFPKYVTSVGIESINLLNDGGLRVADFQTYTESDIVKVRVELAGTQTMFIDNTGTNGTNIIINANIEVDDYAPAREDQIKLYYCNEGVATYQSQTKWTLKKSIPNGILKTTNGFDVEVIKYQAPSGLIAINGIVNYDGNLSEVRSVKQGPVSKQVPINSPSRVATMELLALNNTENVCSDIVLIGRVPFKGNKDVISGEEIGTTTDSKMISGLKEDVLNTNTTTIYYSVKADATKDLNDGNNLWTENPSDFSTVKSYMIVIKGDVEAGAVLRYTYDFEIPENLPYEAKIAGSFGAYYKNNSEVSIFDETSSADEVALETEAGPKLEAHLSVDVGNGNDVGECRYITYTVRVTNTGSITANDVVVNLDKPKYTTFCAYETSNDNGNMQYIESSSEKSTWKIEKLEPGETQEYTVVAKTGRIPTIEDYNSTLIGFRIEKDDNGYYYEKITYTEKEVEDELIPEYEKHTEKVYITKEEMTKVPDIYINAEAEVSTSNLGNNIKSNEVSNKLTKSKFDIVVNVSVIKTVSVNSEVIYRGYVKNISGEKLKNVKAVWDLPNTIEPTDDALNDGWVYDSEKRTITKIFEELDVDASIVCSVLIKAVKGNIDPLTNHLTLITEDGNSEQSSDITMLYTGPELEVSQVTNITDGNALERNNVEFLISIKNIGNGAGNSILITDEISPNLTNPTAQFEGTMTNKVPINNGNIRYTIPSLGTSSEVTLKISGTASDLNGGNKVISNKATITYNGISIDTNEIQIAIKENTEPKEEQRNQGVTNNYASQSGNSNSSSSSNKPNNTSNNKVEKGKNTISGMVWLDTDKNGRKDEKESTLSSIVVQLYRSNSMLQSTITSRSGKYNFTGLTPGDYYVVFKYDGNKYTSTGYQMANVEQELNSNATETSEGSATTSQITVTDANISNINLGLKEKQNFDLTIDKVITRATVIIDDKKEESKFDSLKIAKVEIKANQLNKSKVDLEYRIDVINNGDIAGKATTIMDILPSGMEFDANRNEGWTLGKDGVLYNISLKDITIAPGEKKELKLVLTRVMNENNVGVISNKAQLTGTESESELSENIKNNVTTQEMMILIKTGSEIQYTVFALIILLSAILVYFNKNKVMDVLNITYKNSSKDKKKISIKKNYK